MNARRRVARRRFDPRRHPLVRPLVWRPPDRLGDLGLDQLLRQQPKPIPKNCGSAPGASLRSRSKSAILKLVIVVVLHGLV